MPDIVISEFMDTAAVDSLATEFDVHYDPELAAHPEMLAGVLGGARALIVRNRTQVDENVLHAAPALQVVGRLGVGLDNIDVDACRARGVAVCPATGANDVAVAEYVVAAALVLRRGAFQASSAVRSGSWPREGTIGFEVNGDVLGLVGFGATARATSERARALGMTVIAHDPHLAPEVIRGGGARPLEALEALLETSHVVSLHVPLSPATRGLIGAKELARMPEGAVLINCARGGVVDEDALIAALASGRLGGAALDVFNREPLDADSGRRFPEAPNLLLTPHVAGVTRQSNVRVSAVTAHNVRRVLRGEGE